MGHHRASGRLAIPVMPISTSAAGRQFPAGPIAPSTAPALTCLEGQTNHRLPEFSANVTPVTSARSAGREDQYVYFWHTASGTSAARRAVVCLPSAETRYGSTHDVYAHTSVEELRPSQSFKPTAECPLFPQQRTHRRSIASVSESRLPRSAFPSRADLWWSRL